MEQSHCRYTTLLPSLLMSTTATAAAAAVAVVGIAKIRWKYGVGNGGGDHFSKSIGPLTFYPA